MARILLFSITLTALASCLGPVTPTQACPYPPEWTQPTEEVCDIPWPTTTETPTTPPLQVTSAPSTTEAPSSTTATSTTAVASTTVVSEPSFTTSTSIPPAVSQSTIVKVGIEREQIRHELALLLFALSLGGLCVVIARRSEG